MLRCLRSTGLAIGLAASASVPAFAQTPPLVFTFTVSTPEATRSETILQASAVVEERGLALWSGAASDFGVGAAISGPKWMVRSITSMTTLRTENQHRPKFQQIEIIRPVWATGVTSVAAGGGLRQEWDGTRVLIGRVLAASDVAHGRVQGSLVMERVVSSPLTHDAADVITSLGWSRRIGDRFSLGAEGIGQDLEGLWDPAEADGGARLLVGPSLHVQSRRGDWVANLTAGPVIHQPSVSTPPGISTSSLDGARHVGLFISATWVPSLRR